jgi:hypothetical protein
MEWSEYFELKSFFIGWICFGNITEMLCNINS